MREPHQVNGVDVNISIIPFSTRNKDRCVVESKQIVMFRNTALVILGM